MEQGSWKESKINFKKEARIAIPVILIVLAFIVVPDWKIILPLSLNAGIVILASWLGRVGIKIVTPYISITSLIREVMEENNIAAAIVLFAMILFVCSITYMMIISTGYKCEG